MKYYAVILDRITPLTQSGTLSSLRNQIVHNTPQLPYNRETINYAGFHNDFIKPPEIYRWWHYMESLYIIGTDWSSQELSEHFTKTAQAHGIPILHIVLEVNLRNRFGWLPKDAWEWIDQETVNSPVLKSIFPPKT